MLEYTIVDAIRQAVVLHENLYDPALRNRGIEAQIEHQVIRQVQQLILAY